MAWRNASRADPCSICKKPDWCRYESDADITDCYRACGAGGVQKHDKIGQVLWRHYSGKPGARSSGSAPTAGGAEHDDGATGVAYQRERADADVLHEVYSDLIATLPLYERHSKHLHEKRKLTDAEIEALGYRSFPDDLLDAQRVIDPLVAKHGIEKLLTVPGFDRPERHVDMIDQTNGEVIDLDATEMRLSGARGILLPQRDAQGRIVGMMIRLDDPPNPDPKKSYARYLPLTSYTYTGSAASIGVHVPIHAEATAPLGVRVIEGIIKADIATLRTRVLSLGIPSGGRWEQGVRAGETLGAEGILLSPDADTRTNMGICATLALAASRLEAKGTTFFLEVWPFDDKTLKGLDDVLNAGKRADVNIIGGVERWRTLQSWLASSKAPRDPSVEARIVLDGVVERVASDPMYAFKPGIAEALAVLDAGSVEVQRTMAALKESLRGSWRDFERKVKEARSKRARTDRVQQLKEVVQSGRHVFKRGDQVEARDALLDDLTPVGGHGFDHTLCVFDCGALHKFEDGIYVKIDEAALITKVTEFAGAPILAGRALAVSRNFAKGAVELSYDKCTKKDFFRDAPHGVAFQNIFLRVDPKTKQIHDEPLRREHRVRSRYEFEYERGARPTKFLELLDVAFAGKPDKTECIRVLQQFTGASIVGLATKFQRAMILRGKGNDAKSTLATILAKAMPAGTVSAVPPQSFGHPYSRAALDGMLLNCVSETPENDILDAGPLKAIITGDKIEARNPYERPFTMEPRAGLLLVLNNLFKVKDTSRAFSRRWVIVDFENEVENADRFKVEQIVEEVPAIVSWAIEGLRDLLANDYVLPASSQAAVDEWLGECDTVRQYVEAQIVALTPEEKIDDKITWPKGDAIYADYKTWVRDNGHAQPLTSVRFLRRLRSHLGMVKGEGHKNDGNYYPVRLRAVAEMIARAKEGDGIAVELHGWDPNGTGRENLMYRLQGAEAELARTKEHIAARGRCNLGSTDLKPALAKQEAAVAAAQAALLVAPRAVGSPDVGGPAPILDPTLPHGDYEARVVSGNPDTGDVVLDVSLNLQAPLARVEHVISLRGAELESFVMSVIDEHSVTVVTFEQVREGGNSIAKIVGLRRPAAMEKAS